MPKALEEALAKAKKILKENKEGRLPRQARIEIWRAMNEPEGQKVGQKRRAALALSLAEKVKHFWNDTFPGDYRVDDLLLTALNVLNGGEDDHEKLYDEANDFSRRIFDLMTDESRFVGTYAGHAAISALFVAMSDEAYDYEPERDDYDLDAEDLDTSFQAAMAYGGGDVGEKAYNIEKRREFWQWYLDEAVPNAYKLFK
jgi:hypothetical protein